MTETPDDRSERAEKLAGSNPDPIQHIREALARLRFGAIQLTVHEGKLVQIEVTEKRRFA